MTISELQIQLDLSKEDITALLGKYALWIDFSYFFVDSEDGQCYLFGKNGKLDDIKKVKTINEDFVKKDIKKIVVPESVESIGKYAFWNCSSLTSINIPESVKSIGYRAFEYCTSLTSIKIPEGVTSIGEEAFDNCISLTNILFKGKTIDQVKAMKNYPWGIEDESVIKCEM